MKINVLELCEAYGGGVRRQVDYLNQFMDRSKFNPIFLVSSKRDNLNIPKCYIIEDGLSSLGVGNKYLNVLKKIHRIVNKNNIKVIHAHSTIAGVWGIAYKVRYCSDIPIIFTPHAYYSEVKRGIIKDYIVEIIEKMMNRFFYKVVHVSRDEENFAFSHNLISKKKSVVINNGVPEQGQINNSDEISFINVARCDYQKDPFLFIKLAREILKVNNSKKFVWVGNGPMLDKCRKRVLELGLENSVKFIGYSDNPYRYLKKAKVYLATSRYEGQPFSILEALSVGKPLIITDVIGHTELVQSNGVLFDKEEPMQRFVSKVKYVEKHAQEFSESSYQMYLDKYDVRKMVRSISDLYTSACSR